MTDSCQVEVLVAHTAPRLARMLAESFAEGWDLAGPVQVAISCDQSGCTDERYVGTVTRPTPHSSGPSVSRGSEVPADPDLSGSGAAPSLRGGRAVESPPDRDPLDQDPMLDDTARESIWDRPE